MIREKISLSDTPMSVMIKMSEGNPGATTVLMVMKKKLGQESIFNILSMDDMNIRGAQIWLGYSDHCGKGIDKFLKCVGNRDAKMVATINANYKEHTAVVGGGSWRR